MTQNQSVYEILTLFPAPIKEPISRCLLNAKRPVYELRLFANGPVCIYAGNEILFISKNGDAAGEYSRDVLNLTGEELKKIIGAAAGFSFFAHEREISRGFLTCKGFRIGLVNDRGEVPSLDHITGAVIRLPQKEVAVLSQELCAVFKKNAVSVLVAGAPGSGKTTVLRKMCRYLCGTDSKLKKKVCVIDENGELLEGGALRQGCLAQVLYPKDKAQGIVRAVRYLSPDYIICDEIASTEEAKQILQGVNSGVGFIASIHAGSEKELLYREPYRILHEQRVFDHTVLLGAYPPGTVKRIYSWEELNACVLWGS